MHKRWQGQPLATMVAHGEACEERKTNITKQIQKQSTHPNPHSPHRYLPRVSIAENSAQHPCVCVRPRVCTA